MGCPGTKTTQHLSQLPHTVLVLILQWLPQQDRLCRAALVCSSCATAAAAATEAITYGYDSDDDFEPAATVPNTADYWKAKEAKQQQACASLQGWLDQHSQQLVRAKLSGHSQTVQLDFAKLQRLKKLKVEYFTLRLQQPAPSTALAHSLPLCQRVHLYECTLNSVGSLMQLLQQPRLQHLKLDSLKLSGISTEQLDAALTANPPQLQRLTRLSLEQCSWADTLLQHCNMSSCPSLRELELCADALDGNIGIWYLLLPCGLTALTILDNGTFTHWQGDPGRVLEMTMPQQLPPQMDSLLALQLWNVPLPTAVLNSLTRLHALELTNCRLLPGTWYDMYDSAPAATAFLQSLAELLQLRKLALHDMRFPLGELALEQYAVLTASSHLTHLSLRGEGMMLLPPGSAQHMFITSKEQQLRQLKVLKLETWNADRTFNAHPGVAMQQWCLTDSDLSTVVKRCPHLQTVALTCAMQPGSSVAPLLQLKSCQQLHVGGPGFTDLEALHVAKMTWLTELHWDYSPDLTDFGLRQLTALTGLKALEVCDCDTITVAPDHKCGDQVCLQFEAGPEAAKPDVYLQLGRLCHPVPLQTSEQLEAQEVLANRATQQQEAEKLGVQ